MKTQRFILQLAGFLVLCGVPPTLPAGVVFTPLVSFAGTNGSDAQSSLLLAGDGNFYGTTTYGGTNGNYGTIFRLTPAGTFASIFSFAGTNGSNPLAALTQGADGRLYGVCKSGGNNSGGTFFQITTNGAFTSLASFSILVNGSGPLGAPAQAADGWFYGTASTGSTNYQSSPYDGTVFKVATNGVVTPLGKFSGTNGNQPTGGLTPAPDGSFYGTTAQGGTYLAGTVFKLTASGSVISLASFAVTNGSTPSGTLAWGLDGNLYGTTISGGQYGAGTVFRVTTGGAITSLYSFDNTVASNGFYPHAGLVLASDGNFYGTTYTGTTYSGGTYTNGTIFRVTPAGAVTFVYSFSSRTDGGNPDAGLTLGADGNFYGTTTAGGAFTNGTIFRLSLPLAPVFRSASTVGNSIVVSWTTAAGQSYQPQYCTNIAQTNWYNLGGTTNATGGSASVADPIGAGAARFYRISVQP